MSTVRGTGVVIVSRDIATPVSSKRYKRLRWRSVGKCCHPITTRVGRLHTTARCLATVMLLLSHHPITALVPVVTVPLRYLTRLLRLRWLLLLWLFSAFTSSVYISTAVIRVAAFLTLSILLYILPCSLIGVLRAPAPGARRAASRSLSHLFKIWTPRLSLLVFLYW